MPLDQINKRKRGFNHGSSNHDYTQHLSENGVAKSLYTVQNMTEASALIPEDCEESEERKQKR